MTKWERILSRITQRRGSTGPHTPAAAWKDACDALRLDREKQSGRIDAGLCLLLAWIVAVSVLAGIVLRIQAGLPGWAAYPTAVLAVLVTPPAYWEIEERLAARRIRTEAHRRLVDALADSDERPPRGWERRVLAEAKVMEKRGAR